MNMYNKLYWYYLFLFIYFIYFLESRKTVIVLEESELSENGSSISLKSSGIWVSIEPWFKKIKGELKKMWNKMNVRRHILLRWNVIEH